MGFRRGSVKNRHVVKGEHKNWFRSALILPAATMLILGVILYSGVNFTLQSISGIIFIFSVFSLILANVLIFYLLDKMAELMEHKKTVKEIEEKNKIMDKHFHKMEKIQKDQAVYIHNINQYVNAIGMMLEADDIEGVQSLVGKLQDETVDIKKQKYCSSNMMNIILLEKEEQAKKHNIEFLIHIAPDFDISSVEDYDLIGMAGNLIDNAIEAAGCGHSGEIVLNGFMGNNYSYAVLEVINTFVKAPVKSKNKFISGKEKNEYHGIGMEYIKTTAEKYNGMLRAWIEEDKFHTVLMIGMN